MKRIVLSLAAAGALALSGCGSDDGNTSADKGSSRPTAVKVSPSDQRQKALQHSLIEHFSSPVGGYSPNVMGLSVNMDGPGPDEGDSSLFDATLFVDLDGDDGPAGTTVIKYRGVVVHSTGAYTYGTYEVDGNPSDGDGGVTNGFIEATKAVAPDDGRDDGRGLQRALDEQ